MDYMFALQRQHDHQFSDNVSQLRDSSLVELEEVVQHIDVDEDRMRSWLASDVLGVSTANRIEFAEQRRSCFSIWVEKNVFEESSHQVQIVKAKSAIMSFLCQKENDLSKVVSDEALIWISGEAPEGEPDEFLEKKEVFLLVVVELMEGVQLIWSALKSQNQVVSQ